MPRYVVREVVEYSIRACDQDEAESIAVEYPEQDPTYELREITREITED